MNTLKFTHFPCAMVCLLMALWGTGQPSLSEEEEKTGVPAELGIASLKSPDPQVRLAALRGLQTSLDPRLPESLIPLLSDEGTSTRRIAARAIGSRWWQITKDRIPAFLSALRKNERSTNRGVKNMTDRALGLLQHDYRSRMFARSASKRWTIYERRGLPCLIDTRNHTEELLGWTPEHDQQQFRPRLRNGATNHPLDDAVLWHPRKEIVAFAMVSSGRPHPLGVWVWQHRSGLQKMEYQAIFDELGHPQGRVFGHEFEAWKGDELRLKLTIRDSEILIGWDVSKNKLRTISRRPVTERPASKL